MYIAQIHYLHSTMYLLNQVTIEELGEMYKYLHSTMYLLNLNHAVQLLHILQIYIPLCIY